MWFLKLQICDILNLPTASLVPHYHRVVASRVLSLVIPKQKTSISTHSLCIKVHTSWNYPRRQHRNSTETAPRHSSNKTQTGWFSLPIAARCHLSTSTSCLPPSHWILVLCWLSVSSNKQNQPCVRSRECVQIRGNNRIKHAWRYLPLCKHRPDCPPQKIRSSQQIWSLEDEVGDCEGGWHSRREGSADKRWGALISFALSSPACPAQSDTHVWWWSAGHTHPHSARHPISHTNKCGLAYLDMRGAGCRNQQIVEHAERRLLLVRVGLHQCYVSARIASHMSIQQQLASSIKRAQHTLATVHNHGT